MPKDDWRRANLKAQARAGFYRPGGAGPTGPVAQPLPKYRLTCSRCRKNSPRRGSSFCRPCERMKADLAKMSQPETDRDTLLRMYHVTRTAYLTRGGSETFNLMLDLEYALDGEHRPNLVERYGDVVSGD